MGLDAIALTQPTSTFDRIVQRARGLAGNVSKGVAKRMDRSRVEDLHLTLPANLEAEVIHFQRLLIKGLKGAGVEDVAQRIKAATNIDSAIPDTMELISRTQGLLQSPDIRNSIQVIKGHIDQLRGQYDGNIPHKIQQLITTIRPPEIMTLNLDIFTGAMIAIAGYCLKELLASGAPPPPPPPPSPRRP